MEKITDNELETGMMEGLGTMKLGFCYDKHGVSYEFWSLYALAFQFRGPHIQIACWVKGLPATRPAPKWGSQKARYYTKTTARLN